MNKPNYEVKLLPQLEKACGLDLHKDKIVGFISDKDGKQQELQEYGTLPMTYTRSGIGYWAMGSGIA